MFRALSTWGTAAGSSTKSHRHSRRAAMEVACLENRSLLSTSPITITEALTPQSIGHAQGRPLTVDVSGTVTDSDTTAALNPRLAYSVFSTRTGDQVGHGTAMIAADGGYSFDVRLFGNGLGRHNATTRFMISVTASDNAGNSGSDSALVTVASQRNHHDRGHGTGEGSGFRLTTGGAGEGQSNSVSVTGNNNTVTQYVSNTETNTYDITVTNLNNAPPPPPPHHPGPPHQPAPPPPPAQPAPPPPQPGPPQPPGPPRP
jgi:hypothetical protein